MCGIHHSEVVMGGSCEFMQDEPIQTGNCREIS